MSSFLESFPSLTSVFPEEKDFSYISERLRKAISCLFFLRADFYDADVFSDKNRELLLAISSLSHEY